MHIAFFHNEYPFGGAEKVTSRLAVWLAAHGHNVEIVAARLHVDRLTEEERASVHFTQLPGKSDGSRYKLARYAELLVPFCKERDIEVLIVAVVIFYNFDRLATALPCKVIYACHDLPLQEIDYVLSLRKRNALQNGGWKRIRYRFWQQPREYVFHSFEHKIVRRHKRIYNHCDAYTVLCEGYKQELCRRLDIDPEDNKFVVMPNAIPPAEHPYSLDKKKVVLYLGRLSYAGKRIDRLLEIWGRLCNRFPHWELKIVGDGEERDALEREAHERQLPRVTFCGSTTDPWPYYNEAAILCLTSTLDSWGLVLCEAQQAGVIPIAFDCSEGVRAILSPSGRCGVLIPPFDMDCYTEELARLMSDETFRRSMQQPVIDRAAEYDPDKIGKRFEKMLADLWGCEKKKSKKIET